jgi:hypothetical protein
MDIHKTDPWMPCRTDSGAGKLRCSGSGKDTPDEILGSRSKVEFTNESDFVADFSLFSVVYV